MNLAPQKYRLSFISGGLFLRESIAAVRIYSNVMDWDVVRQKLMDERVISYNTLSTAKRLSREIILRLKSLYPNEILFFENADIEERRLLLWLAICRTYEIIPAFVNSVLSERLLSMREDLSDQDFERFLQGQEIMHPEIAELSPSTRTKLRAVLYRMLGEMGFFDKRSGTLKGVYVPQSVRKLIETSSPIEMAYYPGQSR